MTATSDDNARLLSGMSALALEAGALALSIYQEDFDIDHKADASPVTEADRLWEEIILKGLGRLAPAIPVLAEEAASEGRIPELGSAFFLVDPLDGTREFITKTGEFTVNIALVRDGRPRLGVVYAPAIGKLYLGAAGAGATLAMVDGGKPGAAMPIRVRPRPTKGLIAVGGLLAQILPDRRRPRRRLSPARPHNGMGHRRRPGGAGSGRRSGRRIRRRDDFALWKARARL